MSGPLWTVLVYSSCLLQLACLAPLNTDLPSQHQEFTYPSLVDSHGNHLSYDLTSHQRHRRSTQDHHTYFKINAFDHSIILNVSLYAEFLQPGADGQLVVEYMHSNGTTTAQGVNHKDCHHVGHVQSVRDMQSGAVIASGDSEQWVSVSSCQGQLHGIVATKSGYIFIEPVMSNDVIDTDAPRRHTVHKNTRSGAGESSSCSAGNAGQHPMNGVVSSLNKLNSLNRLKKRSLVSEITIETAVIADKGMLEEHGRENLESYLFTLMGVVHHLYKDSTIGHSVTLSLVRTIILEDDPEMFSSTNNGYRILDDFCSWQHSLREHSPGPHFDVAVLVTRKDICESSSLSCGTLGLADISSVCNSRRSCNVNKDTGLSTAFTIAHEIGHNLGLRHDGDPQVHCSSDPRYLMAPSFAESLNPHMWSACSREQLKDQLSQKTKVSCLFNKPGSVQYQFSGSPILHGMEYSPTEQCRLQAGNNDTEHCPGMADECRFLWCRPSAAADSKCAHQHSPPASGTACTLTSGGEGVCHQGVCMEYSNVSVPQDGGWGQWGEWSSCSLTCGMGVQYSDRECDSPVPANGGQWCPGAGRRYRVCNTGNCSTAGNFRDTMCQKKPPNTQYSSWKSASLALIKYRELEMCRSHCVTESRENVIYSIMDNLPDGAPCLTADSRGVCVQGTCEPVGCDGVLGRPSYVDECGVWCGSGDSCVRVSSVFKSITHPGNYFYYAAGCLPEGSANIVVEEVVPTPSNYITVNGMISQVEEFNGLVRRSGPTNFFFANSNWTYARLQNSTEYFTAKGPVSEGVLLYVLANAAYPGIRYSFSVPKSGISELCEPAHYWRTEEWGACEADCGPGERTRAVSCVTLAANKSHEQIVDSFLCDPSSKPASQESCHTESCVYAWTPGSWGECDAACGDGRQTRNVICKWIKKNGEQVAVNETLCDEATGVPASVQNCTAECSYRWNVSAWSSCNVDYCGDGEQSREVTCGWERGDGSFQTVPDHLCSGSPEPSAERDCQVECTYQWSVSQWSSCAGLCGEGEQDRVVSCEWMKTSTLSETVSDGLCRSIPKPLSSQPCPLPACTYTWIVQEWSECDVECGEGWKTRDVSCLWEELQDLGNFTTERDALVSDDMCSSNTKPDDKISCVASESCATTPPCQNTWMYCQYLPRGYCTNPTVNSLCCQLCSS